MKFFQGRILVACTSDMSYAEAQAEHNRGYAAARDNEERAMVEQSWAYLHDWYPPGHPEQGRVPLVQVAVNP
jgi:hypothetical protein